MGGKGSGRPKGSTKSVAAARAALKAVVADGVVARVDPQELIRAAFEERLPKIIGLLDSCLDRTVSFSALCPNPKCGRRVQITGLPDHKGLTDITRLMFELGIGRPVQMEKKAALPDVSKGLVDMSVEELEALVASER